jgi:uncharacterized membrane protein YcaP (DUF421 family)
MVSLHRLPRRFVHRVARTLEPSVDRLGNRNPQLLRELKGRLKPAPVLGTLAASIAGQALYGFSRWGTLPSEISAEMGNDYCLGPAAGEYGSPSCIQDALGNTINWPLWWADTFPGLHGWILAIAIVIGSYLLIADWSNEEERGTLNPIRLSPRSAPSILLGKLLGVPLLVYVFLLTGLPFYLMAMMGAGRSPLAMVAGLTIDLAQLSFWFTTSLLFAACSGKGRGAKAILGALVVTFSLLLALRMTGDSEIASAGLLQVLANLVTPSLGLAPGATLGQFADHSLTVLRSQTWFGWPIGASTIGLTLLSVTLLSAWSSVCWAALIRRFDRPQATFWSKVQSYGITAGLTLISLGSINVGSMIRSNYSINTVIEGQSILFWLLLPLGLSLVQSRQALLDWMRQPKPKQSARFKDWLTGEFSPPWLALGVNGAIGVTAMSCYFSRILTPGQLGAANLFWGLLLLTNLLLLLVGITQLLQLRLHQKAGAVSALTIAVGLFGLPIGLLLLGQSSTNPLFNPLWLLTFYPFAALSEMGPGPAIAVLCGQWLGLALIYRQFDRSLRQLSRSDFAAALSPTSNPTSVS